MLICSLLWLNAIAQTKTIDSLKQVLKSSSSIDDIVDLNYTIGLKTLMYDTKQSAKYEQLLDSVWRTDKNGIARLSSLQLRGKIYRIEDMPDKAINTYIDILSLKPDSIILADVYFNMGMVYSNMRLVSKALDSYNKSIELYMSLNIKHQIPNIYSSIADIYNYYTFEYDKAEEYYKIAINNYLLLDAVSQKSIHGIQAQSVIHHNLGRLYIFKDKYKEAESNLTQSLKLSEEIADSLGVIQTSIIIGELYNSLDKYDKAYKVLMKLEKIFNNYPFYIQAEYLREWTRTLAAKKDFKRSYMYCKSYIDVRDSMYTYQSLAKVAESEDKYNKEKLETELKYEAQKSKSTYLTVIVFIISALFIAVILLYILVRKNNKMKISQLNRELIEKDLDVKRNQLLNASIKHTEKINILNDINSDLKQFILNEKLQQQSIRALQQIISKTESGTKISRWDEFETRFSELHSDFFERLNIKHPNLSVNERKICAMLRLNMSNPDIASLLAIETKSVNVAKSRLRQKLNLEQGADIFSYIMKF